MSELWLMIYYGLGGGGSPFFWAIMVLLALMLFSWLIVLYEHIKFIKFTKCENGGYCKIRRECATRCIKYSDRLVTFYKCDKCGSRYDDL